MLLPSAISAPNQEKKIPITEILLPTRQKGNYHMDSLDAFLILFFLFIGVLTRIIRIHFPNKITYEEESISTYLNNYYKREYFFDTNPPLGKLIVTGVAYLNGYYKEFNLTQESNYSFPIHISIRLFSAIFSGLCVPLSYAIMREIGLSYFGSSLTSIYVALDISLIVEGKFTAKSGINHFFVLFAFFSIYINEKISTITSLIFEGICFGLAVSIDYNAWSVVVAGVAREMMYITSNSLSKFSLISSTSRIIVITSATIITHYLIFYIHLCLLPYRPTGSNYIPFYMNSTLVDKEKPDWNQRGFFLSYLWRITFLIFDIIIKKLITNRAHTQAPTARNIFHWLCRLDTVFIEKSVIVAYFRSFVSWGAVMAVTVFNGYLVFRGKCRIKSEVGTLFVASVASLILQILSFRNPSQSSRSIAFYFNLFHMNYFVQKYFTSKKRGFITSFLIFVAVFSYFLWYPFAYGIEVKDMRFLGILNTTK